MEPLAACKILVSGLIRRFLVDGILQGLALAITVFIFAANVSTGVNPVTPVVESGVPEMQHPTMATSPTAARVGLRHRLVTGAAMTNHSLTDAYFFSLGPVSTISAKDDSNSKQG